MNTYFTCVHNFMHVKFHVFIYEFCTTTLCIGDRTTDIRDEKFRIASEIPF